MVQTLAGQLGWMWRFPFRGDKVLARAEVCFVLELERIQVCLHSLRIRLNTWAAYEARLNRAPFRPTHNLTP